MHCVFPRRTQKDEPMFTLILESLGNLPGVFPSLHAEVGQPECAGVGAMPVYDTAFAFAAAPRAPRMNCLAATLSSSSRGARQRRMHLWLGAVDGSGRIYLNMDKTHCRSTACDGPLLSCYSGTLNARNCAQRRRRRRRQHRRRDVAARFG